MSSKSQILQKKLDSFTEPYFNKNVCIVYQYSPAKSLGHLWYHMWGLDVLSFVGSGFERLGLNLKIVDMQSFIKNPTEALHNVDFVVNLVCGNQDISYWGIVPSIAKWYGKKPIPNTAETMLAGERKDIANIVAKKVGLNCPKWELTLNKDIGFQEKIIAKPRDHGSSVGIMIGNLGDISKKSKFNVPYIYQNFISGYDVTVGVLWDPVSKKMRFGDAIAFIPKNDDQTLTYDDRVKEENRLGKPLSKFDMSYYILPHSIKAKIGSLFEHLGGSATGRVDFRVATSKKENLIKAKESSYYFIETNPSPTIATNSSFVRSLKSAFEGLRLNFGDNLFENHEKMDSLATIEIMIAFSMLGYSEFTSTSNEQLDINLSGV